MDTIIKKKEYKGKTFIIWAITLIFITSAGYMALGHSFSSDVNLKDLKIGKVEYQNFEDSVYLSALVIPKETVHLDAVDGGTIDEILVDDGQIVEAGQAIAKLANTNLQLNMIFNQSQITEQINNLNILELQLEQNKLVHKEKIATLEYEVLTLEKKLARYNQLVPSGGVNNELLQAVKDELSYKRLRLNLASEAQRSDKVMQEKQLLQISASIKDLKKNLTLVQKNLDKLTVRAPIEGKVTGLDLKVGQSLNKGQLIAKIDSVEAFELEAYVDEFYLGKINSNQIATIESATGVITVVVKKIMPTVSNGQFKVSFSFQDDQQVHNFIRGQSLQLKLTLDRKENALVVRNAGFFKSTRGEWIYVLDEENQELIKQIIKTGKKSSNSIEIIEGLSAGQKVVVSSYQSLKEQNVLGYTSL